MKESLSRKWTGDGMALWGDNRNLFTDTDRPFGRFEQDLNEVLGDRLRASVNDSKLMYGALTNVDWFHADFPEDSVGYSFRAAGDVLAAIHKERDYLYWYCSSREGVVPDWVEEAMTTRGWRYELYDEELDEEL
jgi:hypothetical protein